MKRVWLLTVVVALEWSCHGPRAVEQARDVADSTKADGGDTETRAVKHCLGAEPAGAQLETLEKFGIVLGPDRCVQTYNIGIFSPVGLEDGWWVARGSRPMCCTDTGEDGIVVGNPTGEIEKTSFYEYSEMRSPTGPMRAFWALGTRILVAEEIRYLCDTYTYLTTDVKLFEKDLSLVGGVGKEFFGDIGQVVPLIVGDEKAFLFARQVEVVKDPETIPEYSIKNGSNMVMFSVTKEGTFEGPWLAEGIAGEILGARARKYGPSVLLDVEAGEGKPRSLVVARWSWDGPFITAIPVSRTIWPNEDVRIWSNHKVVWTGEEGWFLTMFTLDGKNAGAAYISVEGEVLWSISPKAVGELGLGWDTTCVQRLDDNTVDVLVEKTIFDFSESGELLKRFDLPNPLGKQGKYAMKKCMPFDEGILVLWEACSDSNTQCSPVVARYDARWNPVWVKSYPVHGFQGVGGWVVRPQGPTLLFLTAESPFPDCVTPMNFGVPQTAYVMVFDGVCD